MKYIYLAMISLFLGACQATDSHVPNEASTRPYIDTTIWKGKVELFVEMPSWVRGEISSMAIHFTNLDKHKPVKAGRLTVSLIHQKKGIRTVLEAPTSPGIYKAALQPLEAGVYDLHFDWTTASGTTRFTWPNTRVYDTVEEASSQDSKDAPGDFITFLKEQAWKIDFQTVPVERRPIHQAVSTLGTWEVAQSGQKNEVSTAQGVVSFLKKELLSGTEVRKGEALFAISSAKLTDNNLQANIDNALAEKEQHERAYQRAKKLVDIEAISATKFEALERAYKQAEINYKRLKQGRTQRGKIIRAPFTGYVQTLFVKEGDFVEQGQRLISFVQQTKQTLAVQIPISALHAVSKIQDIYYQNEDQEWVSILKNGGSLGVLSRQVDATQPLPILYVHANQAINLPSGFKVPVEMLVGTDTLVPTIPTAALLENYGQYSVIVQHGGESYEHRPVELGRRNTVWAEVIEGLEPNEYVVSKGAYQVKSVNMNDAAAAHGHAH